MSGVVRALELEPGNAEYWWALARLHRFQGADPTRLLQRAVAANPREVRLRIELAQQYEIVGRLEEARAELEFAAQVNRKFLPRWALMNFHYRHGPDQQFWKWARAALETSYGDRWPLFELCWSVQPDPEFLVKSVVSGDPGVQLQFARFLLHKGATQAVGQLVRELAQSIRKPDAEVVEELIDGLIQAGEAQAAWAAWSTLCERQLLPYVCPKGPEGPVNVNPDFHVAPRQRGFDWRVSPSVGVFVRATPNRLKIELDGRQPEHCLLLWQWVFTPRAARYRLVSRYQLRPAPFGPESEPGLRWRVTRGAEELGSVGLRLSGEVTLLETFFRSAEECTLARLELWYQRPLGSPRFAGELTLLAVEIQPLVNAR